MEFHIQNSVKFAARVMLAAVSIAGVIVIRLATGKPWAAILKDPVYSAYLKIAAVIVAVAGFIILFIVNNNFFR